MTEFIRNHQEILYACASLLGILLTMAFGGVLSWRHKICLDYESRRDVAINILRDSFVQRTSAHYAEIAAELGRKDTTVDEIYKRPGHIELIRQLAKALEDQNRVKRLFRWLVSASQASFGLLWGAVVAIVVGLAVFWMSPSPIVCLGWAILVGVLLLGVLWAVTVMWWLDGRFFQLVHRIIEPEGE